MESKNEIDTKNIGLNYFDDMMKDIDISCSNILIDKKYMRIFQFMAFHTELQQVQNHCVLGSIKWMGLLGFMVVNLDIFYYLIMD